MFCKQAARLASDSLVRRLSAWERFSLRFHTLICATCAMYGRQLALLRQASRRLGQRERGESFDEANDAGAGSTINDADGGAGAEAERTGAGADAGLPGESRDRIVSGVERVLVGESAGAATSDREGHD